MSDIDGSDEEETIYNLFISEDYVEKTWKFGDIEQPLLCSTMSCTSHDLTGQIVWPASELLSWYLVKNLDVFKDKHVIELGAGCGLAGLLIAQVAKSVLITDGNDVVMRLLQRNKEHLKLSNVIAKKLMWGMREEIIQLLQTPETFPEYIIGADIILWPAQVKSLVFTLRWLLYCGLKYYESPKAFISYVVRAHSTTDLFLKTANDFGLQIIHHSRNEFVPEDITKYETMQTILFEITLQPEIIQSNCNLLDEVIDGIEDDIQHSFMPC